MEKGRKIELAVNMVGSALIAGGIALWAHYEYKKAVRDSEEESIKCAKKGFAKLIEAYKEMDSEEISSIIDELDKAIYEAKRFNKIYKGRFDWEVSSLEATKSYAEKQINLKKNTDS